ncbi:hypothetical protein PoB_000545200 [Plakobranchus ocellatus]|uniref:Uncharacterized protein n=1 Tax=Plakobranchus ocellatus TaxID=259542 RepID=A0AAV3Y836_9GAST|nr:hypothetical protein PoB_000545200 [Plakobranchus ocellatus]
MCVMTRVFYMPKISILEKIRVTIVYVAALDMRSNGGTEDVGGAGDSDAALRSAGTLMSRVRAPPTAPWPDGGPESLRSACCGMALHRESNSIKSAQLNIYPLTQ